MVRTSPVVKHAKRVPWRTLIAFVAVVVAAAAGLESVHVENQRTRDVADRAARRAARNAADAKATAATNARFRALRSEQVAASHMADVAACERTHRLTVVVERIVQSEIDAGPLIIPGLTVAQRAALAGITARAQVLNEASLVALRKADCLGVDAVPKAKTP